MNKVFRISCCFLFVFAFQQCATYYQKNLAFQEKFVSGNIDEANKELDKSKKAAKKKNRLLYYVQKGLVLQLLGQYEESNKYFEEAYYFIEDFKKNYSAEALGILTNPGVKPYEGEDFEVVLIHYFKAMNFVMMKKFEEALIECRRLDIKINELNDRYENRKNRYKKDAFILNLTGIIYDATGDYNNAFIAYRNAYNAYKEIYGPYFKVNAPEQLKDDLLRSAYLVGFKDELEIYEQEFGKKYVHNPNKGGEVVFFWHNGLGPIKDEWSINFFIVKGAGGVLVFENKELGLNFAFPAPPSGSTNSLLGDIKMVRAAFPKYLSRVPYYSHAVITYDHSNKELEVAEDINNIAFATLEDRMMRELGTGLLRLALKQLAEYQIRQQNQNLGALVSVFNAVSEKADTRNWQTLPYEIAYARIPLKPGKNSIELKCYPKNGRQIDVNTFDFDVKEGETVFQLFHSLESFAP